MQKLLNKRVAESAKPQAKPYEITDTSIPGFLLRVQPTGAKLWKLRYTDATGKRTVRTLGRMPIMTHAMAAEKATAILQGNDPDKEAEPEPEAPEVLTFGGYLEDTYSPYLEQNHSRPGETLSYLRQFGFEAKPLTDIRLADVETWRVKRQKKGRSPATINRMCATLKAALQRAVDWELIPDNPLARLKPLRIDKRRVMRYLTDNENQRLLAALKARDDKLRNERTSGNQWRRERGYDLLPELGEYADNLTPLILLALNTGLRRGELWNLAWGDVDLKRKMLTVHGKGAKSKQTRHIPLNGAAVHVLKTHRGKAIPLPTVPVFGRAEFKKAFASVLDAAQIEGFRFHDLRHTFASRLVSAGIPLNTVRELLGHASLEMTLIYAHLAPDNLRQAVEALT